MSKSIHWIQPRASVGYLLSTHLSLDQNTSSDNRIDGSAQCQESSRKRQFIGSWDAGFKNVFLLDVAIFEGLLAAIDQVCDVFVVPSGADNSNSDVASIKVAEGYFAFRTLLTDHLSIVAVKHQKKVRKLDARSQDFSTIC